MHTYRADIHVFLVCCLACVYFTFTKRVSSNLEKKRQSEIWKHGVQVCHCLRNRVSKYLPYNNWYQKRAYMYISVGHSLRHLHCVWIFKMDVIVNCVFLLLGHCIAVFFNKPRNNNNNNNFGRIFRLQCTPRLFAMLWHWASTIQRDCIHTHLWIHGCICRTV